MSTRGDIVNLLVNHSYDYIENGDIDGFERDIELPIMEKLCELLGHQIEDDHCGIPSHRYCTWCGKRETVIKEAQS